MHDSPFSFFQLNQLRTPSLKAALAVAKSWTSSIRPLISSPCNMCSVLCQLFDMIVENRICKRKKEKAGESGRGESCRDESCMDESLWEG